MKQKSTKKGTPALRRDARLARIAGAVASGRTVTDIAEAEGISRAMASREANSLECRQLLIDFTNHERELMLGLFYRGLRVTEEAFEAKREYPAKDGSVVYGGPDHYARLAATKHLRDFLTAGRPTPKPEDPRDDIRRLAEAAMAKADATGGRT